MRFSTFVSTAILLNLAAALPRFNPEDAANLLARASCTDKQTARTFRLPAPLADSSSKRIPDAAHPFRAPRSNETRGPCPALNTLANHGYIDRSGVDTAENIITAVMEGMNMERDFAAFSVALAVLGRGNANTGTVSIGRPSGNVPPLPGCIDGPQALGLATHGRFEGDVSLTRLDQGVGNNADLDKNSFNKFISYIRKFGDDGVDGPKTVLNLKTLQEYKFDVYNAFQQEDKQFKFHMGRQLTSYAESTFTLELFKDGRTNKSTINTLTTFFVNQTFPQNYFRRAGPAGISIIGDLANQVRSAHPVGGGANDANGNYVLDAPNAVVNFPCDGYSWLVGKELPTALNNQAGTFGSNANGLLDIMFNLFNGFAGCPRVVPGGPNGV